MHTTAQSLEVMPPLTLEKQELMQALLAESSESSKLKEMNKELSQKLEVQTQRLELLTAQSMANENIHPGHQIFAVCRTILHMQMKEMRYACLSVFQFFRTETIP
ncbi:unnamed protein product [Thlaspi arvense]|uniref:Uncharacterized protein n=1 Tax=Thlaspi arvense TaxID=13288 RepID=A0AAU9TCR2_THLAR|nr:unnamed protein product [Thlaspi arvense]